MFHDGIMDPRQEAARGLEAVERRREVRLPFPAELLVAWFNDMRTQVRYRVIDASERGFRLRTSIPLLEGMTGVALKMLPEGQQIDKTVSVAWIRAVAATAEMPAHHEAGLRVI
jgi:PilZ domain